MSSLIGELKVNAFISKLEFAKKKTVKTATEYVRFKAKQVLKAAVMASPQWSGNYAANWHLYTNRFSSKGTTSKFKVTPWRALIESPPGPPKVMGDMEAVNWVLRNEQEVIDSLQWNTKIKLVNDHPLSEAIEVGQLPDKGSSGAAGNDLYARYTRKTPQGLRPRNRLPGDVGIIAYLKSKPEFSYLK